MSLYSLGSQFNFVDSQFGTGSAANIKSLVNKVIDRKYHKAVQAKNWFRLHGMIGADTYNEGDQSQTAAGYPVIVKTDLQRNPGDTIEMGQRTNLSTDVRSVGIVGDNEMVNNETGWDFNHKQVKIERWREGVLTHLGMNAQRNPYESLEETEMSLLADYSSATEDISLLYALFFGHAPHLFRQYGTTNLPPTANPNTLFGNDTSFDTSKTIADLTGAGDDNVKGITFEIGSTYAKQNNFDLVSANGDKFVVALISPAARLKLMRDEEFRNALQYARERGITNPLFKYATFVYGDTLIFEYDRIRTELGGYNPAGITVANEGAYNSTLATASYTGIGGGLSSSQLHQTVFLGANALALAEGSMKMGKRLEDDYGNILGRDVDNIFGATRMDWTNEAGTVKTNSSSLVIVNSMV